MLWLVVANAVAGGFTVWSRAQPVDGRRTHRAGYRACPRAATLHLASRTSGTAATRPRPSAASRGRSPGSLMIGDARSSCVAGTLVYGLRSARRATQGGRPAHGLRLDRGRARARVDPLAALALARGRPRVPCSAPRTAVALAARPRAAPSCSCCSSQARGRAPSSRSSDCPRLLVIVHVVLAALVWVGALRVLLDTTRGPARGARAPPGRPRPVAALHRRRLSNGCTSGPRGADPCRIDRLIACSR